MQTIKVMSIIWFVIFVLSLICIITWGDTPDNDAALGWGMIGCLHGVADFEKYLKIQKKIY